MTCIVAISDGTRVLVGGDSAGVTGWNLTVRGDHKVFRAGPYAIGFTTSFRMGQVLRYAAQLPEPPNWDVNRFMCTYFVDEIRRSMREAGWLGSSDGGREDIGSFIVGWRERIFVVHSDLQVACSVAPWASVGCGADFAIGALCAMPSPTDDLEASAIRALKVAEENSAGVRGPFTTVST